MKRILWRLGAGIPAIVLAACLNACTGRGPQDAMSPNAFEDGSVAIVADVDATRWPRDAVAIDSAVITHDTLTLLTTYAGGCQRHRFALLLGEAFMESHPVQIHARLAHDGGSDMCDALVRRRLTFDLQPLKARYRAVYGAAPATIVINLTGVSRGLRYSFD